jgi:SAM-dependent methyltransferase
MDNVRRHYDQSASDEWQRLEQDAYHSLEFRATMNCLRRHLPARGRVLDAGGGPGRYTIELCRLGYSVALVDLSGECVALAREKAACEPSACAERLEGADVADIRDLSRFPDASFDAVLCLGGPLSHLLQVADRRRALAELARVAKPGCPVFLSVMGHYAVLRTVLARVPEELVAPEREPLLTRGDHAYTGGFCDTHFFRPEELQALAEEAGLETVELCALEGLSSNLPEATNALLEHSDGRWERWLRVLDETSTDPAVIATSEHFLYVGRTRRR